MKRNFIFLILLVPYFVRGQDYYVYNDAQVRAHLSVETKLVGNLGFHLDQQYRFTNNASEFTRGSADIGLIWKLNRNVRFLASYVHIQRKNDMGYFRQRDWYYGALVLRKNIYRWRVIYRNMVQARFGNVNSDQQYLVKWYDRNKLSVRYEATKRFTFYTSGEVYIPLNNPQMKGIDRSRNSLGVLINTFRNQQLELYFMYQHFWGKGDWWDQQDRYPDLRLKRHYIYGIGYGIEF
jgi:hypothetical protein